MSEKKPAPIDMGFTCPLPLKDYPRVLLAHGGGGTLMHQLIQSIFADTFRNEHMDRQHDAARLQLDGGRLAFTTDSYVVDPLVFPGGDIGSMAVHGTVNDLAMAGARPLYLSAGFILEEGLEMEKLYGIVLSMQHAAERCGVQIVTGDTKVVNKGKGDGVFINTAGVGIIEHEALIAPESVRDGDAVIVSGDLGRHGMAILAAREELGFEVTIESDSAPVHHLVRALLEGGVEVHCLRDLTRGGLASALNEIALAGRVGMEIEEHAIPVIDPVRSLGEVLGLDPVYVANEGRFAAFVAGEDADRAVEILRGLDGGEGAVRIGRVTAGSPGQVTLRSRYGAGRLLTMLSGEQLPRIC